MIKKMMHKLSIMYLFILFMAGFMSLVLSSEATDSNQMLMLPSYQHLFGTDSLGRDLFLRVIEGSRVSLLIGVLTAVIAFFIALAVSSFAQLNPGKIEKIITRFTEILISLPNLVLICVVMLFFMNLYSYNSGAAHVTYLSIALVLTGWMNLSRQIKNLLQVEFSKPYIEAAKALGASPYRLLFKHALPNMKNSLVILLGLQIPSHLLFESTVTFVGFGVQPPMSSWGVLIQEGWKNLSAYPHLLLFPSLILFITVYCLNILFDQNLEF